MTRDDWDDEAPPAKGGASADAGYDVHDIVAALPEPIDPPAPHPMPKVPIEVSWLSRVIGASATLRLVEGHGGVALYIPHEVNQSSPLARMIGLDAARQLSAAYGGERRVVPFLRWWRISVERSRGLSDRDIARKMMMTEAAVSRLLRATNPKRTGTATVRSRRPGLRDGE